MRRSVSRRAWLLGSAFGAALLAQACLAPTLPLPPPSRPDVEGPLADGSWELSGNELPNSEISARNARTGLVFGQLTGSDGAYRFRFEGTEGDRVVLSYTQGTDRSPSIEFDLKAR